MSSSSTPQHGTARKALRNRANCFGMVRTGINGCSMPYKSRRRPRPSGRRREPGGSMAARCHTNRDHRARMAAAGSPGLGSMAARCPTNRDSVLAKSPRYYQEKINGCSMPYKSRHSWPSPVLVLVVPGSMAARCHTNRDGGSPSRDRRSPNGINGCSMPYKSRHALRGCDRAGRRKDQWLLEALQFETGPHRRSLSRIGLRSEAGPT